MSPILTVAMLSGSFIYIYMERKIDTDAADEGGSCWRRVTPQVNMIPHIVDFMAASIPDLMGNMDGR